MKYSLALIAGLGLAAASHANHQHLHRRDAMQTVTDWTVVTVTDVVTVYGESPVAKPTPPAVYPDAPVKHTTAAAQSPAAQSPAAQSPAAQSSATPSPAAQSPAAQSPAAQSPAAHTTLATSAVPKPAASTPSSDAGNKPSTGGSASGSGMYGMQPGATIAANCPEGTPCVGDMTTYSPGLGSCGYNDASGEHADDAVALQIGMFGTVTNSGPNSPSNPLCNKRIQIVDKTTGVTAVGVIRDACPGCSHPSVPNGAGIDLAPALMGKLLKTPAGQTPTGRLPIEWYFLD